MRYSTCIFNFETQDNCYFFFFNDTATTEIYTLSLHDALPISLRRAAEPRSDHRLQIPPAKTLDPREEDRSEEHTSELQSQSNLVCRLLLEKKKILLTGISRTLGSCPSS